MDEPARAEAARNARTRAGASEPVGVARGDPSGGQTRGLSAGSRPCPDGSTALREDRPHTDDTASWIRDEHLFYAQTRGDGRSCRTCSGWDDDGERPVMVAGGPFRRPLAAAVDRGPRRRRWCALLGARWPHTPPAAGSRRVPPTASSTSDGLDRGRRTTPQPFLALGTLLEARGSTRHLPIAPVRDRDSPRSRVARCCTSTCGATTCCIRGGRALFMIDWNFACVGNPLARRRVLAAEPARRGRPGARARSLHRTRRCGACRPARRATSAAHAARPEIPEAPHVRPLQRKQARTALPWAARALGLPPPMPPA